MIFTYFLSLYLIGIWSPIWTMREGYWYPPKSGTKLQSFLSKDKKNIFRWISCYFLLQIIKIFSDLGLFEDSFYVSVESKQNRINFYQILFSCIENLFKKKTLLSNVDFLRLFQDQWILFGTFQSCFLIFIVRAFASN